jgi:isopenicillin N synthase-like dioxygenase
MKRVSRELPLLDIRQYYSHPSLFVENIRQACHKTGFFLLRHDIPLAQKQVDETRRFFHQSIEDKRSISYVDSPSFRGYMPIGVENTAGRVDLREQVEFAVE